MAIFDHTHPKIIESTFSWTELVPAWDFRFILESCDQTDLTCDQTDHTHFLPCPPKTFWSTLNFCESVLACKKTFFHLSILQIQSILEFSHQTDHTIFDQAHPKNFQSTFNLWELVPVCKKSVNSTCSILSTSIPPPQF